MVTMKNTIDTGSQFPGATPPEATSTRIVISWVAGGKHCPISRWKKVGSGIVPVWNTKFISWLQGKVKAANDKGLIPAIQCRSTAVMRNTRASKAWEEDILNGLNGGPVPNGKTGVPGLYNNLTSIKVLEELLKMIHLQLPKPKYDFSIFLCWENFSSWSKGGLDWAADMAKYWRLALSDDRPIGTGTPHAKHIKELNEKTGFTAYGYIEAWNFSSWRLHNAFYLVRRILYKLPWKWFGFWPDPDLYWGQRNNELKEAYFHNNWKDNALGEIKQLSLMVYHRISPSYHFDALFNSKRWKEKYGFEIPRSYEVAKYQNAINDFFKEFKHFINHHGLLLTPKGKKEFKSRYRAFRKEIKNRR